jgi:hypothetical protein
MSASHRFGSDTQAADGKLQIGHTFIFSALSESSTLLNYNTSKIELVQLVYRKCGTCFASSHYCVRPYFGYIFISVSFEEH